ncbi:uncharacterized protein LOC123675373 [Harmonia axyridis]|uniref:uncharacterized protein LOC123675373 n=1 Tax=Harmonia axyridis TaxID=115357 RepID=UPI001E2761B0|nr:uncharacterized protein LOC123675373 [Harmonia axyridis]
MKFTVEEEMNSRINFLDISISKLNDTHNFSIFHKPTHTDTTIHITSNHPYSHKMAAYNSMIHRLITIPMNHDHFNTELNLIKQIAINNGYNPTIIDKILFNKQIKHALLLAYPSHIKDDTKKYISLTYVNRTSERIAKYFKDKFNLKVSFKTNNNLGTFVRNNKDKTNKDNKSGVYKLKCGDCHMVYIGQTERSFKKRIHEHQKSFTSNTTHSTYANHLKECRHEFNNNYQILHTENKSSRLTLLESLEINRYNSKKVLLNEQTDVNRSPLLNIFNQQHPPI